MAKYIKPTLDTKFYVDFSWWNEKGHNLRSQLLGHLCLECKDAIGDPGQSEVFDWVSGETGEVFQIDMLWHVIRTHCSRQPSFIDDHTPLTAAIFRTFIANDNTPLTPIELYEKLQKKNPELILRTIGGRQIYQGIRPLATAT